MTKMTTTSWLASVALGLGGAGCASFSTHLDARPTEKGKMALSANVDVLVTRSKADGETIVAPVPEFGLRYGFSDRADFGGKISLSKMGGELNSRIALVRSEVFDLAIVPGAGLAFGSVTSDDQIGMVVTFGLPLLAGIRLGDAGDLVIGAKMNAHFGSISGRLDGDGDGTAQRGILVLYPGAVLGVELELAEGFAVMPEINVHFPYDTKDARFAKPLFQGGLGFTFDL